MNQRYNIRFANVNLLDVMGSVVEAHTKHYQSDFALDTDVLRKAAVSCEEQDKRFIWLCRENGTWCLRERDVYMTDSWQHNTFKFYIEQTHEPVLAFVVEVIDINCYDGSIFGNLYPMDYHNLYDHVKDVSQLNGGSDYEHGVLQSFQFSSEYESALRTLLWNEKRKRGLFPEGDVTAYLASL